jgi:hypothetical protein
MCPLLHRQIPVEDIAFNVRGGLQNHSPSADRTNETTADHDVLSRYVALNLGILAEDDRGAVDVALNAPIDMELTG